TFQNYFRLYKKLSGMTGTAATEAREFDEIYKLDVVEIPTNKPLIRDDKPDVIFQTEKGKYHNVIKQIKECHEKGQPVLVGTISIEKSEHLSKLLKKEGIPHNVLNAKNHEKEAEIVAQAGKYGQVTISTNMAGRGTDIMLGGNAEFLAKAQMKKMKFTNYQIREATGFAETDDEEILEARRTFIELEKKFKEEIADEADKVREAGGLFILGTERHDARRIDNQLRGRSGRQGDPGASQFYLSCEDDLMRLFGGDRMQLMMAKLTEDEDTPIENKLISKTIESSQKKVEGKNFEIRKNTLQYDDVMNRQRELIYKQRDQVLDGLDLNETINKMIDQNISDTVAFYFNGDNKDDWNVEGLREKYKEWNIASDEDFRDIEDLTVADATELLQSRAAERIAAKHEVLGDDMFGEFERMILLRNVDTYWMDHIDAMDDLKKGIHLRSYAQRDPVVAYRMESGDMFEEMTSMIREDTAKDMLTLMPRHRADVQRRAVARVTSTSSSETDSNAKQVTIRKEKKIGPNDPCPCGSGIKYKKCHGAPGRSLDELKD
ncbi:MAG: SEC-C domain-containing protein, partial [Eubacterium sp.]|nr:SEC-C domain-containing protein [Eubacterium sp.]